MSELKKYSIFYSIAIFFFFSIARYFGYAEDAGRYLLQVVNYLHPERFVNDVPFMYGNQDSFTIFSPFISLFYKAFGVNAGGMVATFVMLLCGILALFL